MFLFPELKNMTLSTSLEGQLIRAKQKLCTVETVGTDVSISGTEKYDLVYVFRGAVDSREAEIMHG